MRTLMVAALLLTSATAYAQTSAQTTGSAECWPSSHIDNVAVKMVDGTTHRGSLLCLGPEELTLAEKPAIGRFRLENVLQIRKAADPVWDGAAKGASVGLLLLVLCGGHCPAEAVIRTTLGYGALGLAIDAIDTHTTVIYQRSSKIGQRSGEKHLSAGFRLAF